MSSHHSRYYSMSMMLWGMGILLMMLAGHPSACCVAFSPCTSMVGRSPTLLQSSSSSSSSSSSPSAGDSSKTPVPVPDPESDWETADEWSMFPKNSAKVVKFLQLKYPRFYEALVQDNVGYLKELQESTSHTMFVVSDTTLQDNKLLSDKQFAQLADPRNAEIRDKMGSYHLLVGQSLTAAELLVEDWTKGRPTDGGKPNSVLAAIVTPSGNVPVGRQKTGQVLGVFGGTADGEMIVGPNAQIIQSYQVGDSLIHEVDDLISPTQLWRYADQLRIPGF